MLRWWCWQGPVQFDIVTVAATQFFMSVCACECVCVCLLRAARCRNSKLVRKRLQPTSALASQLLWSSFDLHRTVNCGRYFPIVGGRRPPKRGMPRERTGLLPFWICMAWRPQVVLADRQRGCTARGTSMGFVSRVSRISIYSQLVWFWFMARLCVCTQFILFFAQ